MKRNWIAIDWGTTNFRAFLLKNQQVIASLSKPCGLLAISKGAFSDTLFQHLKPWLEEYGALPVVMAGMVGSQQGWQEVPYVSAPATAQTLRENALSLATPWGSQAWIIPGVSSASAFGLPDVMRGEEIQLMGLYALHPAREHCAILPGTHSKHAQLSHGEITHFSTLMTGELFSLLTQHSLLGRALPEQQDDSAAFVKGVLTAQAGVPFSHLIFSARTRRLNGELEPSSIHSYLSGLLIGNELSGMSAEKESWLVGSPALCKRYRFAADALQIPLRIADGDTCFLQGMGALYSQLQEIYA
ncbi:TPA: 2-dehydro-3-deoxygalactonokinase [Citrobacter farmeri]